MGATNARTREQPIITILVATVPPIVRDGIDLGDLITLAQRQLVLLSSVVTTRQ
jgi:hypothetical protein